MQPGGKKRRRRPREAAKIRARNRKVLEENEHQRHWGALWPPGGVVSCQLNERLQKNDVRRETRGGSKNALRKK